MTTNPQGSAALVDWDEIVVGDVLVLGGEPWDVTATTKATAKKARSVTSVRRRDGKAHTGTPRGEAKRLERAAPAIPDVDPGDLARATVESRLGGEVVAQITPGDPWHQVPRVFAHPGTLMAHLYVYHGVREWPEGQSPVDQHDDLHRRQLAGEVFHGGHDHTHDLGED